MNLIEQMAIIAHEEHAEMIVILMWGSFIALATFTLGASLYFTVSKLRKLMLVLGPIGVLMVFPLWAQLFEHGSTKGETHLWKFQYYNGLTDDGSTCGGDVIWGKWTATQILLDGNYVVKMTYRDASITNSLGEITDEWHTGEDCEVNDLQHMWIVPGATNMEVTIFAEYVSPIVVHTNGVYRLERVMPTMDGESGKFVTPSTAVKINMDSGEIEILTPTNRPPQSSNLLMQQEIENE